MADGKQRPSWMVPAVVGAGIVLFIVIAFVFGLGGRPKGDASGTRAVRALQSFGTLAGGASRPVPVR